MTVSDWMMIVAVLVAPLLAVQAQKRLEILRENRERKLRVFKVLMATRANTVSQEHVQALNMIDLEFVGKKYDGVTGAWRTYLEHLGGFPRDDEKALPVWADKQADLLAALLLQMGRSLGYKFDVVDIKKGIYAPEAHARLEHQNNMIRVGLLGLLYGKGDLKMDVVGFPSDNEAVKEQKGLRDGFLELLDGKRELPVVLREENGIPKAT